jgi:hypothetical protein
MVIEEGACEEQKGAWGRLKAGRDICGALGAAVSAGLPPSKAMAQKKSSSSKASFKKQRSERSERQQKLLSIVVTTGAIYELGAVVCEWALRVYQPWW